MRILATDMDRTLLPNGEWPGDDEAIPLFNELTAEHDLMVVYVTGRNVDLVEQAIDEFGVRHPHALIGDVGTTIRRWADGQWLFDDGWISHVRNASPRWDPITVQESLRGIDGLQLQEEEHLNRFKQSCYLDGDRIDSIMAEVRHRIEGGFDEVLITSHDPLKEVGLLDVQPAGATKQTALEYLTAEEGQDKGEVVFCGDSGNDIFPLTAGFLGVLVRNADTQLVASVEAAQREDPELRAYFARGGFHGLSGYYAGGVLEGANHYGLFGDQ